MFKILGDYNHLGNPVESMRRGYDRVEPSFVKEARKVKDAPVDKFIRYSKKAIENSRAKKFKNFIYKFFSYIKNI